MVRYGEEVRIDPSGKLPGRGAYLHDRKSCWSNGLKGSLEKALRMTIHEQNKQVLCSFMETLDDDPIDENDSDGLSRADSR